MSGFLGKQDGGAAETIDSIRDTTDMIQLYPFSSAQKCMSVLIAHNQTHHRLYTKVCFASSIFWRGVHSRNDFSKEFLYEGVFSFVNQLSIT